MPKKDLSKNKGRLSKEVLRQREETLKEFFDLKPKALDHIKKSLEAEKECLQCAFAKGTSLPGKAKDAQGQCKFCHGLGAVPDNHQRNWATGEVADRIAPKPKAIEVEIDDTSDAGDLEKANRDLSTEEIDRRLKALGQSIENSAEN